MAKLYYQGHASYRFTIDGGRVITHKDALAGGNHNTFDMGSIKIEAVQAKGLLHSSKKCVGYLLVHMAPGKLFDRAKAEKWDAPDKLIVEPDEEIAL